MTVTSSPPPIIGPCVLCTVRWGRVAPWCIAQSTAPVWCSARNACAENSVCKVRRGTVVHHISTPFSTFPPNQRMPHPPAAPCTIDLYSVQRTMYATTPWYESIQSPYYTYTFSPTCFVPTHVHYSPKRRWTSTASTPLRLSNRARVSNLPYIQSTVRIS